VIRAEVPAGLGIRFGRDAQPEPRGSLRQAGLQVPGVYGPSREEWTAYGMQPPAV
jgi:hypothetical protein